MSDRIVRITTGELSEAVWGVPVAYFNSGRYDGTNIPLRAMTGDEQVSVVMGRGGGRIKGESWIVDRFGSLGARQVKRLACWMICRDR